LRHTALSTPNRNNGFVPNGSLLIIDWPCDCNVVQRTRWQQSAAPASGLARKVFLMALRISAFSANALCPRTSAWLASEASITVIPFDKTIEVETSPNARPVVEEKAAVREGEVSQAEPPARQLNRLDELRQEREDKRDRDDQER